MKQPQNDLYFCKKIDFLHIDTHINMHTCARIGYTIQIQKYRIHIDVSNIAYYLTDIFMYQYFYSRHRYCDTKYRDFFSVPPIPSSNIEISFYIRARILSATKLYVISEVSLRHPILAYLILAKLNGLDDDELSKSSGNMEIDQI